MISRRATARGQTGAWLLVLALALALAGWAGSNAAAQPTDVPEPPDVADVADIREMPDTAEALPPAPPESLPLAAAKYAELRLLNKITAHSELLRLEPQRTQRTEALRMQLRVCYAEPAPARAFVEIDTAGGAELFRGWMVADAPGLNPFAHPIYDVWLTGCSQVGAARGANGANSAASASAAASRR